MEANQWRRNPVTQWVLKSDNLLMTLTVSAVILGIVTGGIIKASVPSVNLTAQTIAFIAFPGELLMNILKMLIIPLMVSSLITGMSAMDTKSGGKMGMYTIVYYLSTTFAAAILGIILVVAIHPGDSSVKEAMPTGKTQENLPPAVYAFLDLLRNIFPPNIIQACTGSYQSVFTVKSRNEFVWIFNATLNQSVQVTETINETIVVPQLKNGENMLGIVTFSIIFGMILGQMGEQALTMVKFFSILNEIVMKMIKIAMWYSPIGIFFLIIGNILSVRDLGKTAQSLGLYMVTVIAGLIIHSCLTLAMLFWIVTRRNPILFFKGVFQAFITALGTSSSVATLPVTFSCLENNLGIDKRVTRFVLPVGASINMDGTALYEAVAAIFIAQINGVSLSFGPIISISITATLAAIGAASVPSAGLVTMIMVLSSVGLPTSDISLIVSVDWFLDRLRTSVNVLGDAFGAGIVHSLCKQQLAWADAQEANEIREILSPDGVVKRDSLQSSRRISAAAALKLSEERGMLGISYYPPQNLPPIMDVREESKL